MDMFELFIAHVAFANTLHTVATSDPVIVGTFKAGLAAAFHIIFTRIAADIGFTIVAAANTGTNAMCTCFRNIIGKRTASTITDRGIIPLNFACLAAIADFCHELSIIAIKARFLVGAASSGISLGITGCTSNRFFRRLERIKQALDLAIHYNTVIVY